MAVSTILASCSEVVTLRREAPLTHIPSELACCEARTAEEGGGAHFSPAFVAQQLGKQDLQTGGFGELQVILNCCISIINQTGVFHSATLQTHLQIYSRRGAGHTGIFDRSCEWGPGACGWEAPHGMLRLQPAQLRRPEGRVARLTVYARF